MYYVLSPLYPYPTPVWARGTHHCIGGTWASLDLSIGGASSPVCATPGPGPTARFSRLLCAVGSGPCTRTQWVVRPGSSPAPPAVWFSWSPFCSPWPGRLGVSFPAPPLFPDSLCHTPGIRGPEWAQGLVHLGSRLSGQTEGSLPQSFRCLFTLCVPWECWGLEEESRKKKQKETLGPPTPLFLRVVIFLALYFWLWTVFMSRPHKREDKITRT